MNILRLAKKRPEEVAPFTPEEIAAEVRRSCVDSARGANQTMRNRLISTQTRLEAEIESRQQELAEIKIVLAASDAFASTLDQAEQIAAE